MSAGRVWIVLVWLTVVCCAQPQGCSSCERTAAIATLFELRGGGMQHAHAGSEDTWKAVEPGAQFHPGDSVRTDAATTAKLRFTDGSELLLQPSSLLRFPTAQADDEHHVDLITGEAVITAGAHELRLRTHVGLAVLRAGGSMHIKRADNGLAMHLDVGEATFQRESGPVFSLPRGETIEVEIGAAVIRAPEAVHQPEVTPPPTAAGTMRLEVGMAGITAKRARDASLQPLATGETTIDPNTDVHIPAGANATLKRHDDRLQLDGAGEYHVGDGKPLITTQRGHLQLDVRSQDVHIAVPGGWIIARAIPEGSNYEIRVSEREGTLTVKHGEATWNTQAGSKKVSEGQPFRWRIDRAAREENARTDKTRDATPPEKVSFTVRAGESFVVHSPTLPVAMGVAIERMCEGEGLVELSDGTHYRGSKNVHVSLSANTRGYAVRCANADGTPGRVMTRGNVQPLQDAGTRDLPPRAPMSIVDADGRTYTIYYQNQLPDIRVRWPNPPAAKSYVLEVDSNTMSIDKPEYTFSSGTLRDGQHRLTFTAKERRSRTANIEVHFDNTTTTASLSAPTDRGFGQGDSVVIEGVALPAWKVSADGGTIESSSEGRFHGSIVTSAVQPDFAVRLSHPRLGTHYYVRRAAGTPTLP